MIHIPGGHPSQPLMSAADMLARELAEGGVDEAGRQLCLVRGVPCSRVPSFRVGGSHVRGLRISMRTLFKACWWVPRSRFVETLFEVYGVLVRGFRVRCWKMLNGLVDRNLIRGSFFCLPNASDGQASQNLEKREVVSNCAMKKTRIFWS